MFYKKHFEYINQFECEVFYKWSYFLLVVLKMESKTENECKSHTSSKY